jgi:hypothetical protein
MKQKIFALAYRLFIISVIIGIGVITAAPIRPLIPQPLGTGDSPTFAGLTSNGTITINSPNGGSSLTTGLYLKNAASADDAGIAIDFDVTPSDNVQARISAFRTNAAADSSSALAFYTNTPAGTLTERVRIDTNGNVGIGTVSPSEKLSVSGIVSATGGFTVDTTSAGNRMILPETNKFRFNIPNDGATTFSFTKTGPTYLMTILNTGNVGIGTTSFGTNAAGVLAIANGTAPTTGVADAIQLFSTDLSAGNTILGIYTEGTGIVGTGTPTADRTIAININGTVYYLIASTSAI